MDLMDRSGRGIVFVMVVEFKNAGKMPAVRKTAWAEGHFTILIMGKMPMPPRGNPAWSGCC